MTWKVFASGTRTFSIKTWSSWCRVRPVSSYAICFRKNWRKGPRGAPRRPETRSGLRLTSWSSLWWLARHITSVASSPMRPSVPGTGNTTGCFIRSSTWAWRRTFGSEGPVSLTGASLPSSCVGTLSWPKKRGLGGEERSRLELNTSWGRLKSILENTRWECPRFSSKLQNL